MPTAVVVAQPRIWKHSEQSHCSTAVAYEGAFVTAPPQGSLSVSSLANAIRTCGQSPPTTPTTRQEQWGKYSMDVVVWVQLNQRQWRGKVAWYQNVPSLHSSDPCGSPPFLYVQCLLPPLEWRASVSSKKAKIQVIRINPDISWKIHLFELLPVPFWPPDLWACLVKWTWVASPNNFSFFFLLTEISNALNKLSTLSVPLNQQTCFNWIDFALLLVKSGTVMLLRLLFLLVPAASASHTMCFWKAQRDPVQSTTLQYLIHFGWLTFAAIGKSHR